MQILPDKVLEVLSHYTKTIKRIFTNEIRKFNGRETLEWQQNCGII